MPHQVLNARQREVEAAIIAQAGERGTVTISTNMAGRGTDIRLGEGVAELGGLHVIGTNRHESRRIDNQLRGRAGRQGDPGSSRFFVSLEDDLLVKYGDLNPDLRNDPATIQRLVEGQHLDRAISCTSTICPSRASVTRSIPIARRFSTARSLAGRNWSGRSASDHRRPMGRLSGPRSRIALWLAMD